MTDIALRGHGRVMMASGGRTPAWQRKEGKNPAGGLNRKGIASYRAANPGSKLSMAVTTKPIIFTSGKAVGERAPGDWGGIIILGRAKTNRSSEPTIEGGIGRAFGGTNDVDNSGVLKYVRIEYAGIAAMPNSEINALTLGGVGSGTIIENVQTIYANDDAFEFFGGTVNAKNLYAYATADDDFDFDFGYTGTITNGVAKRDPQFVDSGDAGNGVECDNDGTGSSAQPVTHPKLLNMILVGPNVRQKTGIPIVPT